MADYVALADLDSTPGATVFAGSPRVVRLSLAADEAVPAHDHPGTDVVFHVLEGRIDLALGDERHDLGAGDLLRFRGERAVAPHAREDSTALVVLAERPD